MIGMWSLRELVNSPATLYNFRTFRNTYGVPETDLRLMQQKDWLEVTHDTQSAQVVQCVKVHWWNFDNREDAFSVFLITYIFGFTFFLQGNNFLPYTYKPKVLKKMEGIICKKSRDFSGNERISRKRGPVLSGQ